MADHAESGSFAGARDPWDVVAERVAVDLGAVHRPFAEVRIPGGWWKVCGPVEIAGTYSRFAALQRARELNAAFAAGAKWGAER